MVLWSYRTTSSSNTGETPFSLTYKTEFVFPLEIMSESLRVTSFNTNTNDEERRQDLDTLHEKREVAQLSQAAYKACFENFYNKRIRKKFQDHKATWSRSATKASTIHIDATWNEDAHRTRKVDLLTLTCFKHFIIKRIMLSIYNIWLVYVGYENDLCIH